MKIEMPLSDEQALIMAENLIALLEKGDALAAAVELVNETYPKNWLALMDAARAWQTARGNK